MQTTLIILKPDCVQRGLTGEVLQRFERKGLKIVGGKFIKVPEELAKKHYAEHDGKPFFGDLISFVTSSPVLVLAIQGPEAVTVCRTIIGKTDGKEAAPGTIRGDFGISKSTNLVHGSDSPESADRELALWFNDGEIVEWDRNNENWIDG
jgi:nucleoside-diphosphate kinase